MTTFGDDLPEVVTGFYNSATSPLMDFTVESPGSDAVGNLSSALRNAMRMPPQNFEAILGMAVPAQQSMSQKRIVKVFIADPDVKVPVDQSLLFEGDQKLTDLENNELFFEINIKGALEAHNKVRVAIIDKDATAKAGRGVFLEPVKVRDLRMTVVEIAKF